MKLDKKENKIRLEDNQGEPIYVGSNNGSVSVLIDKHGYSRVFLKYERIRISKEKLENNFEIVDNYKVIDYTSKNKKLTTSFFLYRHKMYDFFIDIVIDGNLEEDYTEDVGTIGDGFKKLQSIFYKSDDEWLDRYAEVLNDILEFDYDSTSKINIVLKNTKGFEFKEVSIKPIPIDIDTMYNDDFKPVYETIVSELKTGSKGIILLHGAAGTGKSNLIRGLTKEIPDKRFVFIPVTMVSSLTDPMFLSTLIDNKGAVLVLEDCENYIKDRKSGDINSIVSSILNITDGILSDVLGLQLICTFNSSIHDVDKALLRRGRLICDYEFKPLEESKAIKLLDSLGIVYTSLDVPKTLADIYNQAPPTSIKQINKIGFGSSN